MLCFTNIVFDQSMSTRPPLDASLAAETFLDHYWLKDELAAFCRSNGIGAQGAKADLSARIAAFLRNEAQPAAKPKRSAGAMPSSFTRASVIEPSWRCSQALRAFFSTQLGRPFHFDRFMREQISNGSGQTLGRVFEAWRANAEGGIKSEIEPQFEYNRFVREFRSVRPEATHQDVVRAWQSFRSLPASQRPPIAEVAGKS